MSITQNALTRTYKSDQTDSPYYRINIAFNHKNAEPLKKSKWQLEQALGTSVSWAVFLNIASESLQRELEHGKVPTISRRRL